MIVEARSVSYRHPGSDENALTEIDLSINEGALVCLLGVNGSGKSTLLALLAGLFAPCSGALAVAGRELPRESAALRGVAAFVSQDPDVYILGSLVGEDLFLGLAPDDAAGREAAMHFARLFGLADCLSRPVHALSYGQRRKLCLASALAASPRLLLLDEPFAGLDHPASMTMRETLVRNKANGVTQIVSGHDLDLAADIADSFILLHGGRLLAHGDAEAVFPLLLRSGVRPPFWRPDGKRPAWLNGE